MSWDDENYYLIVYDSKEDNDIFNKNQGNVRGILIGASVKFYSEK